jgi:hypothetical protein
MTFSLSLTATTASYGVMSLDDMTLSDDVVH